MSSPRLVLPLGPSDNHSHQLVMRPAGKHGRPTPMKIRTPETKAYEQEVGWLAKSWALRTDWHMPPKGQKVVAWFWAWWPDERTHDVGNLIKILGDSLKGVVVVDDRWLIPRPADFAVDRRAPRLELELYLKEDDPYVAFPD